MMIEMVENMRQKKWTSLLGILLLVGGCCCGAGKPMLSALAHESSGVQQTGTREFALWSQETDIYEEMSRNSTISGTGVKYGICYVLEVCGDWCYIESGSVRGFVETETLIFGEEAKTLADELKQVQDEQKADESGRYQYALDVSNLNEDVGEWLKESAEKKSEREFLVSYALEFVGSSYVWGSTDLEVGTDCSGYVQSIYAAFDYELPRTVKEQARAGEQITMEEALPGDLVFYGVEEVYHVAIYLGNEKVVHAMNEETGIVISDVYSDHVSFAVRLIAEEE